MKTPGINPPKKTLGLDKFERNLQKHPSTKALYDKNGNELLPSENIKNEVFTFYINGNNINTNKNESNNNNESDDSNKKTKNDKPKQPLYIQINKCEHKIKDEKETFFIESGGNFKQPHINNNNLCINENCKPLFYGFSENQKEFDKQITNDMEKGKEYKSIERKFLGVLKNQ